MAILYPLPSALGPAATLQAEHYLLPARRQDLPAVGHEQPRPGRHVAVLVVLPPCAHPRVGVLAAANGSQRQPIAANGSR